MLLVYEHQQMWSECCVLECVALYSGSNVPAFREILLYPFEPVDRGGTHSRNIDTCLPSYTMFPRRQSFSHNDFIFSCCVSSADSRHSFCDSLCKLFSFLCLDTSKFPLYFFRASCSRCFFFTYYLSTCFWLLYIFPCVPLFGLLNSWLI
jgi:hypothetical protein